MVFLAVTVSDLVALSSILDRIITNEENCEPSYIIM